MHNSKALAIASNNFHKIPKCSCPGNSFFSSPLKKNHCQQIRKCLNMRKNRQAIAIASNNFLKMSKLFFQYIFLIIFYCRQIVFSNQRKFRNLTSDYTESYRQVLQHQCLTAEMFYSTDARHERFWPVRIAGNALFFHSFVASKSLAKSAPKSEVVRRMGCPRCRQNLHHAVARERFGSQNR